jgi:adenosylmethionine-8-amino-7-oxononanoate aminotransferase/2-polyprenyl-3-methyl-5-hydroxy-6-metoxy-1,4-benzoquinol methylase
MVGYSSLFGSVLGLVTKNIEQLCEERKRSSHFLPFFRDQNRRLQLMKEPSSEDLFWGPFAELRSMQQAEMAETRSSGQVLVTFSEALSALMANTSVPQFQALTARRKGSVLQVGCGRALLLSRLANDGREVTGIDGSAEVLEIARHKLAELPLEIQSHVTLAQTDVTQFDLAKQFSLVLLPFFTFALLERQEQRAVLKQIEHHLAPNATLFFEHLIPRSPQSDVEIMIDTELLVGREVVAGSIGLKCSARMESLTLNCSSRDLGTGAPKYLNAYRAALLDHKGVEGLLAEAGLVVFERRVSVENDLEVCLLGCRRRSDITYPLCHPNTPLNGLEQQVTILVEGKGCVVRDQKGKEYIDASGGLWNTHCGLGEHEIIQAITDQLQKLSYATLFASRGNQPALDLARELVAMAPSPLQWAYLTGSGSESIELAIKIARLYQVLKKRKDTREIVYLDESFHGTFFGSMTISGLIPLKEYFEPMLPGTSSIPAPNSLRCPPNMSYAEFALLCADALEERAATGSVAAFIVEPVLGSAGVVIPPAAYFKRIEQICRKHKILLILDEVATGFGRTGRWFAAEHYDLRPDVLLLSKGMNSGYLPLGAVLFSAEIGEVLARSNFPLLHASTYNGHPACCAAAIANLDLMRRDRLVERAAESGCYFEERLRPLLDLPIVKEIRAIGLMLAVVLVQEDGSPAAPMQIYQLYSALQIAGIFGYMGLSSLTFCPALVITRQQIDTVVERLHTVLTGVRLCGDKVERS